MKETGLTKGNYVEYMGRIMPLTIQQIQDIEHNNACGWPVELTEEWLLKFGFVNATDNWGGMLSPTVNNISYRLRKIHGVYTFKSAKIKYVHQLQNLFFCLSGEELIKH